MKPFHRRIYIIGFMGSGKTTVGKKLAAGLHWSFIDLDREIETKAGKTISKIFSDSGEEYFRRLESEVLQKLDIKKDTVISVGGGAPCFSTNMDFMSETGIVMYLRLTPAQLKSRLSRESGKRPLLKYISQKDMLFYITEKLSEREKYYNKALIIIDGIDLNIKALTDRLRLILES
jgi:shikimate kinase